PPARRGRTSHGPEGLRPGAVAEGHAPAGAQCPRGGRLTPSRTPAETRPEPAGASGGPKLTPAPHPADACPGRFGGAHYAPTTANGAPRSLTARPARRARSWDASCPRAARGW